MQQHAKNHFTNKSNSSDNSLSFKKRHKQLAYGKNYIPEEETIRNDYSLHYVRTGSRPQNQIQNTALSTRFAEYPKLRKLLELKKNQVAQYSHPPMYIQADLRPAPYPNSFNLLDLLPTRFDVIVIDPPLQEYLERYPHLTKTNPNISKSGGPLNQERGYWNWDELENLPIPSIAASPGFIFLWCGSGQGSTLESGRSLLSKWGYRKCEDLVWVKTNNHRTRIQSGDQSDDKNPTASPLPAVFTSTKEHCLMGIRGTVRRSTDGHFVHCNVDTDVIVSEPDPTDVLHKPEELYQLIENFCLGRRRLDLFGSRKTLRPGWLTIGNECEPSTLQDQPDSTSMPQDQTPIPYEKSKYLSYFLDHSGRTQNLLPTNTDVDNLRPRSPPGRIAPTAAMALPHGRGYLSGTIPIIGPDGSVLGSAISGRNTISHPSGGLGRGPGNALLPGMRVSGSRDSSHSTNTNHSRVFNAMGHHHPTSVHLPFLYPNLTPQRHPSTYPFLHPQQPLNPTMWTPYSPPGTSHLSHPQVSTTTQTSYPSFYHPPHSFFSGPSGHALHPQHNPHLLFPYPYHQQHNPNLLPSDPTYQQQQQQQQQQTHVGFQNHYNSFAPPAHPSRNDASHSPSSINSYSSPLPPNSFNSS